MELVKKEELNELPLGFGVFPVAEYDSEGNGSTEENLELCHSKFIMQSVFVYQGDYNTSFFEEANNADEELIYFTILVHSDWNSSGSTMVSSRNHPVYLAQSSIDIDEERKVKWIAVHEN
ncbi:hypothetical protein [Myroides odoratus]|uniref:hypothetical protein n=1 Tax=Myroides odoratus TaxID=256 RepID=UPI0039AF65B9